MIFSFTLFSLGNGCLQCQQSFDVGFLGSSAFILGNRIVKRILIGSEMHGSSQFLCISNLDVETFLQSSKDFLLRSQAKEGQVEIGGEEPA